MEGRQREASHRLPPTSDGDYLPVPDLVVLDEPDVVVSLPELGPDDVPVPLLVEPEPVVPVPLVPVPAVPERSFVDGEVGLPLMPPGAVPVPERVDDDDEELVPVSRPCVLSRSEQAPSASALNAAATATPIALAFITFITTPDSMLEIFPRAGMPGSLRPSFGSGETL